MNNDYIKLSRGCQLCQQGKWLCIFITYECKAGCHFCPSPFHDNRIQSAFSNSKERILDYLKQTDFEGVSFSGGDPFLAYEEMLEWLQYFKKHLPHYYFWVYTNGLLADEIKLKRLVSTGMDEIRFNIAATDYLSPEIWEKINIARKYFEFVSIEIPSIKEDYYKLTEALKMAEEIGIDFLNLHDYIISEKELLHTKGQINVFVLNKINTLKYAESSVTNTYELIKYTKLKKYNFHINHCSMQQKENQMLQRRLKMGTIFNDPKFDIKIDSGLICNYYEFPNYFNDNNIKEVLFDLNNKYNKELFIKSRNEIINYKEESAFKIVQARYIPQMEIDGNKILIDWQVVKC